jgi:hypothetical protein
MNNKLQLSNVTLICVDCLNYGEAISAMQKSMEQCQFAKAVMITDKPFDVDGIDFVVIPAIKSKLEYSKFMVKELINYFTTEFCLVIQHDGYVLDASAWDDMFLQYDYIGAPWVYLDGRNVGNGGFSLRSKHLCRALASDPHIECHNNEDDVICREYRGYLEARHQISFAPEEVADAFSYELREPTQPTFGFHGYFQKPFRKKFVISRAGAMGDIISAEPLIEYIYENLGDVYLHIPKECFDLFKKYKHPIKHVSELPRGASYHLVNLDMAYEVQPRKNHIKAYFEQLLGAGFTGVQLRNPDLYPKAGVKLFKRYVVINCDTRNTAYRNVFGVSWKTLTRRIKSLGYDVIQVGDLSDPIDGAVKMDCPTIGMLQLVIAGANGFIGTDSGPAHIAVAHQVPAVILFGSVNPEIVYVDQTDIMACISNDCPIGKQFCWHEKPGTTGQDCEADIQTPPCCVHEEDVIFESLKRVIKAKHDSI